MNKNMNTIQKKYFYIKGKKNNQQNKLTTNQC